MKQVAGKLRLDLMQYWDLASFAQFGAELDKATQAQLLRGQKIVEMLKQGQYAPVSLENQVIVMFAGINGYMDDVALENILKFQEELIKFMEENHMKLVLEIKEKKVMSDANITELKKAIEQFKTQEKAV